jgi:hypothetical protein
MSVCHICGVPWDAGFFDESNVFRVDAQANQGRSLEPGQEVVLARYDLHPQYCGMLLYFAQFTDRFATDPTQVTTPGYQWQIRCNGRPRDPYLTFDRIINPWGLSGFPVYLRLEEGCVLEIVIRNVNVVQQGDPRRLGQVGGRILGRYWYNTIYGGAPNPL